MARFVLVLVSRRRLERWLDTVNAELDATRRELEARVQSLEAAAELDRASAAPWLSPMRPFAGTPASPVRAVTDEERRRVAETVAAQRERAAELARLRAELGG